jgi:hypothetical protein
MMQECLSPVEDDMTSFTCKMGLRHFTTNLFAVA